MCHLKQCCIDIFQWFHRRHTTLRTATSYNLYQPLSEPATRARTGAPDIDRIEDGVHSIPDYAHKPSESIVNQGATRYPEERAPHSRVTRTHFFHFDS